ncbi:MAG: DUF423 domain-containing protein [Caulobacteraceae bacterium]|nr:DUF423 domain-containing protein [Caulobacteraceae bacterium]
MTPKDRVRLALAALSGFVGVAAGAFGAHGVGDPQVKLLLKTGAEYQMIHALAVFACLAAQRAGARTAGIAAWLFLAGGLLFAGSLYVLALGRQGWAGPITPLGGLMLLAGWAVLAASMLGARDADRA